MCVGRQKARGASRARFLPALQGRIARDRPGGAPTSHIGRSSITDLPACVHTARAGPSPA
ncbi:hypothetical protein Lokhon_02183 [Limimaricola hongkongensis DSM 17492]|uniref:Uncharacterized protein n=1 Tax=Limimaricola hongkongensis DSM 17492 TaxID=1122180 RepID=A0A017H9X4_9RHOB|nr:hypothetical protein Lokhon_02183 [Limimaricola hongkongensis DSM 17492]